MPSFPIGIRRITSHDIDDKLVELYRLIFKESSMYREVFSADESYKSFEKITTFEGGLLLVASHSKSVRPIGFAEGYKWTEETYGEHLQAYETLKKFPSPVSTFHIAELGVHPEYLKRGIASLLLKQLLAHARKNGSNAFILNTNSDNLPAIELYQRFGFSPLYSLNRPMTFPYTQLRVSNRYETDYRPYFYLIDGFGDVSLKNEN